MRIGVTGPNGYIGSSFIDYIQSRYLELGVVNETIPYKHRLTQDLCCEHPAVHILRFVKECDVILHTAGKNKDSDYGLLSNNIESTFNLLMECFHQKKKIIITGSDYTHGAYGASKRIIEKMAEEFHHLGVPVVYAAIPNVYGPGCKPFYNSFIATLCWHMANKRHYEHLVKDRNSEISLIHISDLNKILLNLCTENRYNLAEKEPYAFQMPRYNIFGECVLTATLGDVIDILEGEIIERPISSHHIKNLNETIEWYKAHEKTC